MNKLSALALLISTISLMGAKPQDTKIYTNPQNGHQYFLTDTLSWEDAQKAAAAAGGNLVTINDEQENQWLVNTFIDDKVAFLWIGLNDAQQEGTFQWTSGEPMTYLNWAKGEPNDNPANGGEDFGAINGANNPFQRLVGTWTDGPKSAKLRGIVEISPY